MIVVVDNDGGGIFSFLPQAESVERERFEQLYGTPHGLDLVALASSYGVTASEVDDVEAAARAAVEAGGVHVLVARTDRATPTSRSTTASTPRSPTPSPASSDAAGASSVGSNSPHCDRLSVPHWRSRSSSIER